MTTKVCYSCRSEVDGLASLCPNCRSKLGKAGRNGVARKPTPFLVGCLGVFIGVGLMGAIVGSLSKGSSSSASPVATPLEPVDPKFGPKPDISVMTYALAEQLRTGLHDPSSLQGPDLSNPAKDTISVKGKKVDCWRVGVKFRAKNGLGAIRLTTGTIWMKNGASIKEVMN